MKKHLVIALLAAPAAMLAAGPASAQVTGIATANGIVAIGNSKAFTNAYNQIMTMYKASLDQAEAKQKAKQPLLAQLDKNGDKNVDDNELQQAEAAKNPVLAQLDQLDKESAAFQQPAILAEAYAIETIAQKYDAARAKVVADRKISFILSPDAVAYAPPAADVTGAITAALDATVPAVSITPPAGWQPQRGTLQLLQQLQQYQQYQAAVAASNAPAAPGAAPGAAAPTAPLPKAPAATPGKKPAGR